MQHVAPERLLAPNAIQGIGELLARQRFGKKLVVACDENTWSAAGTQVQQQLEAAHIITHHSFGKHIGAKMEYATALAEAARDADALIAIGAGTVNDLTKYAAAQLGKPYITVATAASMNGYTSANASLEADGFKQSYSAKPPVAVVADISVIAAAPKRLGRAGVGDTLCRCSVEADMLLSHYLRGTPYPKEIFDKLRAHEPALMSNLSELRDHRPDLIALLMEALLDAGDAMAAFGSSAVASQGEHMIAHTLELIYGTEIRRFTHGEIIAVATITMANLQQRMLRIPFTVRTVPREAALFDRVFGKKLAAGFIETYQKKLLDDAEVERVNSILAAQWEEIKKAISEITIASSTLERVIKQVGLPAQPGDLQIENVRYDNAVAHAYLTRDRFTFLDLAVMNDRRAT